MENTKKGLFYENYTKTDEEFSAEELELKAREMKRTFETDYDKAEDGIIKAKKKLSNMLREKFQNFNLNAYREALAEVKDFEDAKKDVAEVYESFFGEKINR